MHRSFYFRNFVETSAKMARSEIFNSINSLSRKIDNLLEENRRLETKIAELENLNRELDLTHRQDLATMEQMKKECEFLTLSHRLASSPEALVDARNKISRLLRTVDSCIRLIKED